MSNVLVVADASSYLVSSLQGMLEDRDYKVDLVEADTDAISKMKSNYSAIIIYADEGLVADQNALIYIKDRAAEEDILIFPIGDVDEIRRIEKVIPKHLIKKEFLRPINVKELVEEVDEHISSYGNHIKKKILVVDDSGAMLRNAKGWLEEKYHVILANSGAMAIKYMSMNRPDLVLLDYEMPIVDGKQVLEMIRSEVDFADIPVIFLTSKGDKDSVLSVMALKPEGYLLKTMPPKDIVKAVDDFFEKRKAI